MALFQQSVIKKHIESLDSKIIDQKWQIYTSIFHNSVKQNNIRNSKEEQFQEGFLRELFVNVLGYTINPDENFNLLTELKNTNNSRKADGAIIVDGKAIAVIELKGTETTDLNKIEIQAFGYKSNQAGCNYVITSNFEKLRFYIDNTTQLEEFNLFTLNKERFDLLYSCLSWDSIKQNTPIQILNESVSKENVITKKLYNDYSEFKRALFSNLVELNPQFDKLLLFKKSQKLLDRFLFIFFAEDRLLLPTNLIFRINAEWDNLVSARVPVSLYDRYKMYFNDLNTGAKVTLPAFGKKTGEAITAEFEIFAYNGGLFQPDEILDTIKIEDALLYNYTQKMSDYNFESDVDVNILGHIFENSLNEIDEIKSEIEGSVLEKTKTRRKKDGVFYTPKYITKYIVDNTIGKLCNEKKEEIKLFDEDYITDKKLQTKTKKALLDKLADYRNWLLDLTICDPACGSGAFLNQALEFLISEHRYIDELQAKLMGDAMILSDIENSILERNIYGVDLNDESVEIAKLSLWLRTAQKGRKLNSLNNNIKCGNSLIDDVDVAGDKAFSWEKEFPDVFAKGGFDVIIGNPPYVNIYNMNPLDRQYYNNSNKYSSTYLKYDIYILFFDLGLDILKKNGFLSYIIPSVILTIPYATEIRKKLINDFSLNQIVDFTGFKVFSDAMVESCILNIRKINDPKNIIKIYRPLSNITDFTNNLNEISQSNYLTTESNQIRIDINTNTISIVKKIQKKSVSIESIYYVSKGIVAFSKIDKRVKDDFISFYKIDENHKEYLEGKDVNRYKLFFSSKFLNYDQDVMSRPTFPELHFHPKILIRAISDGLNATFDDQGYFIDQKLIICSRRFIIEKFINPAKRPKSIMLDKNGIIDEKATLALMNSSLFNFYYNNMLKGGVSVLPEDIRNFPTYLFKSENEQKNLVRNSDMMLSLNIELQTISQKLSNYFSKQYQLEKLTGKLEKWYELEFIDFIKELNKAIKGVKGTPLTKKDEFEWIELFEENKKKALSFKAEIDKTDKEIDQMVYALYELTEEEIKIVEKNNK